jgi:hypothetical protein
MERVSVIEGKKPIIVLAPHGYAGDDENTAIIAETAANVMGSYAVINNGWQRDDNVDFFNDKANCNNVEHCHEDVVREEFLDPILRYRNRILQSNNVVYVYIIHGMANKHRQLCGDSSLDFVIGYGAGKPDSFSCEPWKKDLFVNMLQTRGYTAYEGKKGGPMSGWARSNLNQLFRKWYPDHRIQTMQIEIIHELRADKTTAQLLGEDLAMAMLGLLTSTSWSAPGDMKIKQY